MAERVRDDLSLHGLSRHGHQTQLNLCTDEVDAILALLIERHTVVISSLGITPDVVPT